jgi:tripartite-type tricarboxylate transporter receptor subunit TctC
MRAAHGLLFMGAALVAPLAFAQAFPSKPIHVIVPFPTGGLLDATLRVVGPQVTESTGQPVLIENRPGGATFIGMSACAKAAPDGYTLCSSTPDSLSFNPFLYNNVPYDAANDFTGVTNLVFTGAALIYTGRPGQYNSFRELIEKAKARPGTVNMATWGPGSASDLYLRYINQQFGVEIVPVPYKGAAPALTATLGGEVDMSFWGIGTLIPHLKSGKIKGLVAALKRTPAAPDVPSFPDLGVPDPNLQQYFGLYAPAKVPAPIIDRLNAEFVKAVRSPQTGKFLGVQTFEAVGNSPAEFTAFMKADRENAGRLLKSFGVKPMDVPQ